MSMYYCKACNQYQDPLSVLTHGVQHIDSAKRWVDASLDGFTWHPDEEPTRWIREGIAAGVHFIKLGSGIRMEDLV